MITILAFVAGLAVGYALAARTSVVEALAALKQRFINWLHHGDTNGGAS